MQYPWEDHAQRYHSATLDIGSMHVHKFPVTNEQYGSFLNETGWQPEHTQNWLLHWDGANSYPEGTANQPVIWVSVGDAATYCASLGTSAVCTKTTMYHDMYTPAHAQKDRNSH